MKNLNLFSLEDQALSQKQLLSTQGGYGSVNWCDCDAFDMEWDNSVSTWHSTPYPGGGSGGGGGEGDPNDHECL